MANQSLGVARANIRIARLLGFDLVCLAELLTVVEVCKVKRDRAAKRAGVR